MHSESITLLVLHYGVEHRRRLLASCSFIE
nr:MAG TPA: hypothetical protein [Caudoviricetes sp.]